jgi:hypothetical protein
MKKIFLTLALVNSAFLVSSENKPESWLTQYKQAARIGAESYAYWGVLGAGAVYAAKVGTSVAQGDYSDITAIAPEALKYLAVSAASGAVLGLIVAAPNPKRLIRREKDDKTSVPSWAVAGQFAVATWGTTAFAALLHEKMLGH